jgi:transcriptional regulator with XRE-family HTH domain
MRKFLTQAELTQRSGVARATVTRAERGDEIVTLTNIRKLAEALGITPDELLSTDPDAHS